LGGDVTCLRRLALAGVAGLSLFHLASRVRQWLLDPGSIYLAISAWLALVPKTSSPEEMEVKREELDAMHRSCAA
jgi:hypothetical protein